jgi:HAD superfamily hydrolase (TIGR01509 family)
MTAFDLVIFDCDGVLVDSEALACVVHADVLTEHGYPITAAQVHDRFLGRSSREARFEVETEMGRVLPDEYTVALKATIDRVFGESLQPVPHIAETLGRITQRICVASSGTPTRIRSSLATTGLLDRFGPHLFSASSVAHGKPAPDLFLFAATEMGVPPARCVVIEDSVPGVTGARAAGMTVLGFHGGAHCGPDTPAALKAAGADATFADMRELPGMIARLGMVAVL